MTTGVFSAVEYQAAGLILQLDTEDRTRRAVEVAEDFAIRCHWPLIKAAQYLRDLMEAMT